MNVAPIVDAGADQMVDEGATVNLGATFADWNSGDTHTAVIDWGDGSVTEPGVVNQVLDTVSGSHVYADNGIYTVTVTITDNDGAEGSDMLTVTVLNVAPTVNAGADQTVSEGDLVELDPATFNDKGTVDTHTATIDWGDGTALDIGLVTESPFGPPGSTLGADGTVDGSHVYADDGAYTVTVTVQDDDGIAVSNTFTVTVINVLPTLEAGVDRAVAEGTFINLDPATFTDPGFDNTAGGTNEDFAATIDWGDGNNEPVGNITLVEVPGGEGVLTTGTIDATHAYGDDGVYTVTVTVQDDDGIAVSDTFTVTVLNVLPTLDAGVDQTVAEGTFISLDPATFSDPGFDNAAAGTTEGFTATIDWGDGNTEPVGDITLVEVPGSEGVLTTGTIDATHAYGDDGVYTVIVTVQDDDGIAVSDTFTVTVINVLPTLDAGVDRTVAEGTFISLDPATFSDPGFDNAAAGTSEDFTATIDWGDGNTEPVGDITLVEIPGSEGVLTTGTIDATHAYGDDGVYTVTATVQDDDGGTVSDTFTVTVTNVLPTLEAGVDQAVAEGTFISLDPATFSDPGFDNPAGGTSEDFTATIDWGDGNIEPVGDITLVEIPGSEGVLTTGTIDATHAYGDDGVYTVTVTVQDDDGVAVSDSFQVTVNNVAPTVNAGPDLTVDEGDAITLAPATFSDPGFDNAAGNTAEDFTATIDWGDGVVESGIVSETPGSEGALTVGAVSGGHTYGDNGTYVVTVTVSDDDGGASSDRLTVEVNNVDPTVETIFLDVELAMRIAGEKGNSVELVIEQDGGVIGSLELVRTTGAPNEDSVSVSIDLSKDYTTTLYFESENHKGATPVWLGIDDDMVKITTFNAQKKKPDTWSQELEIDLDPLIFASGVDLNFRASATDAGSDDLTFTWDWGDGTSDTVTTYYNDGEGPDLYPSPGGTYPFSATDRQTHTYSHDESEPVTYTLILTVEDDDGGLVVLEIDLTIHLDN